MAKQKSNRPTVIKVGRGIRAKLWRNSGKNGAWFNVTITRTYKDDDGDLHDSNSFSRDDLLQVAYAAQKSFEYIVDQNDEVVPDDEEF